MIDEEVYKKEICSNCKNKDNCTGTINIKEDNAVIISCEDYVKDKSFSGYKKPLKKTAKLEHTVMRKLISDWSIL